ncbi:MAG TPA: hypothetical protein EYQ24_08625 [Bacteroidetes bacterium]|nr:hypothetical protein [Bacteroidota bacterium]
MLRTLAALLISCALLSACDTVSPPDADLSGVYSGTVDIESEPYAFSFTITDEGDELRVTEGRMQFADGYCNSVRGSGLHSTGDENPRVALTVRFCGGYLAFHGDRTSANALTGEVSGFLPNGRTAFFPSVIELTSEP